MISDNKKESNKEKKKRIYKITIAVLKKNHQFFNKQKNFVC